MVVNCFHLSVSLRYNTTILNTWKNGIELWIAFIYPYLWDTTQLSFCPPRFISCCELLSFIRIFEIQHNINRTWTSPGSVVNCFHLSVSLRYNTTEKFLANIASELWIAFIYPYLWDTTQQEGEFYIRDVSCELLSFIRIFEIQHNIIFTGNVFTVVVNCFHLSVSLRYNTTEVVNDTEEEELWIAFIYPYLWDTTQQNRIYRQRYFSCELLSFIRIFEIQHNQYSFQTNQSRVVNCFHLSVSLRYNTTQLIPNYHYYKLWIAFIYPYLWDTTQLAPR